MLVENFQVSVGVVLGVVLAVTGIYVFSMPVYRSPIERTMLTAPPARHRAAWTVRSVFAKHGLLLPDARAANSGITLFGRVEGLYVFVARQDDDATPRGHAGLERKVGNVLVHYEGSDRSVLARVRATVAALRAG
jgi:hypothetical protein